MYFESDKFGLSIKKKLSEVSWTFKDLKDRL